MSSPDRFENDYVPGGKPLTGGKVLAMILAFFGVVIFVNLGLLLPNAIATFRGLETDSALPHQPGVQHHARECGTAAGAGVGKSRLSSSAAPMAAPMPRSPRVIVTATLLPEWPGRWCSRAPPTAISIAPRHWSVSGTASTRPGSRTCRRDSGIWC